MRKLAATIRNPVIVIAKYSISFIDSLTIFSLVLYIAKLEINQK